MLTVPILIVFAIVAVAFVLFVTEWVEADVTAMLVMVLLLLSGVLTPAESLSGFSHEGTITVFALLVLSLGLQSTGVVNWIGNNMERITGRTELRIMIVLSVVVAFASAFVSNTAVVAILLPVVNRLAKFANISASRLLMPLSFAAMTGGTITLIGTSTNIIISSIHEEHTGEAFGVFEFAVLGLILFLGYLIYLVFPGRLIIPDHKSNDELTKDYQLEAYLTQVVVGANSPLIGKPILESDLVVHHRVLVLNIIRDQTNVWLPDQVDRIKANDVLVIKSRADMLMAIQNELELQIVKDVALDDKELTSEDAVLIEAVIGRNSFLVGKVISKVDWRYIFGAIPLALRRSGAPVSINVREAVIQFGDVILFEARRSKLSLFHNSPDFIVLGRIKKENLRKDKIMMSSLIVAGSILIAATGLLPLVTAALVGCILLFLSGSVSMRYIYRKMEWRVFFLLAGILPLGIAIEKTGASALIAEAFLQLMGAATPATVISVLFVVTLLLTSFISNAATAILVAPIAIEMAERMNVSPKAYLVAVMFAASTSFLTPLGYQTNMLIYGAGQYKFGDFVKVGGGLSILVWLLASYFIPRLYL